MESFSTDRTSSSSPWRLWNKRFALGLIFVFRLISQNAKIAHYAQSCNWCTAGLRLGVIYGTGSIGKPCQFCYAKLVTNAQRRTSWVGVQRLRARRCAQAVCFCFAKTDAFRRLNSIYRLGYCEKKNILFVASRSDTYKVSMQQTVCSAISRGSGALKAYSTK